MFIKIAWSIRRADIIYASLARVPAIKNLPNMSRRATTATTKENMLIFLFLNVWLRANAFNMHATDADAVCVWSCRVQAGSKDLFSHFLNY